MPITADPRKRLALVDQSPAAVAEHDKNAWLALFARYSLVEDPVGSRPVVSRPGDKPGSGPLSRFYDTFIAANDIRFVVERDMLGGDSVVRDLSLEITMAGGDCVSSSFALARDGQTLHGVAFFHLDRNSLKINGLDIYWDGSALRPG